MNTDKSTGLAPLTPAQQAWVDKTLQDMPIAAAVAQLLCTEDRRYTEEQWQNILRLSPVGGVFWSRQPAERLRKMARCVADSSPVPPLMAGDMESGVLTVEGTTWFPWQMACGAADRPDLVRAMGAATAREGRAFGLNWTFSPVADLNLNYRNAATNIRAFGDRPDLVARLAVAMIQGLQADGMLAATAKHFPGDGVDERDQHLVTSVNSLPVAQWRKSYGAVWKAVIDAGVMSVMSGHISFPDYEALQDEPDRALPATLSHRVQADLLRGELGFRGVIVSDASPMIGFTSRVKAEDAVVRNIQAGSDMFLFNDPIRDHARLMAAVRDGRLSEDRVYESVRRILEMKARLNLPGRFAVPEPDSADMKAHAALAQELAEASITVLRGDTRPAGRLKPGARVLTVTIEHEGYGRGPADLTVFDDELRSRGFLVDHLLNPDHTVLIEAAGKYDGVFVHVYLAPHMLMGAMNLTGKQARTFWRAFYVDRPNVFFTAFGSPYVAFDLPHIPNLLAAYSPFDCCQKAAVKVWLGEVPARGKLPVRLPKVVVQPWPGL